MLEVVGLFAGISGLITAASCAYVRISEQRRRWYVTKADLTKHETQDVLFILER